MLNDEVRSIMATKTITVHPDDLTKNVSKLMLDHRVQQVPVVEHGKLVGLITSYDLWRDCETNPQQHDKKVSEIMTVNVVKLSPKDKIGTATELFIDKRFKTFPVVNLEGDLKGVITAFDIIKYIFKKEYPNPILYKDILEEVR